MTAEPELPGRLLTVDAYAALGEDDHIGRLSPRRGVRLPGSRSRHRAVHHHRAFPGHCEPWRSPPGLTQCLLSRVGEWVAEQSSKLGAGSAARSPEYSELGCRGSSSGSEGVGMGKDQRRLSICPQCHGAQVSIGWKRANLDDHPEVQEIQTAKNCPTCDGSGQILGSTT